jgi:hypothetical protein
MYQIHLSTNLPRNAVPVNKTRPETCRTIRSTEPLKYYCGTISAAESESKPNSLLQQTLEDP